MYSNVCAVHLRTAVLMVCMSVRGCVRGGGGREAYNTLVTHAIATV